VLALDDFTAPPKSGVITGPEGRRTDIYIHRGPGYSEGCMLGQKGQTAEDTFHDRINRLLDEDRRKGKGTSITVKVEARRDGGTLFPEVEE
jgi:hypothetical protein